MLSRTLVAATLGLVASISLAATGTTTDGVFFDSQQRTIVEGADTTCFGPSLDPLGVTRSGR